MGWCIATRDQVKSVMLFSKGGWRDLEGPQDRHHGRHGDIRPAPAACSSKEKYGVHATLERLHQGVNDYDGLRGRAPDRR